MRASPLYYIAPSVISITPNCNGTASDIAVNIARGAKIKVCDLRIFALGMVDSSFQEWTLTGRNRRLADSAAPYTIYARLRMAEDPTDAASLATAHDSAYLVFAKKDYNEETDEWTDPYVLSPNPSAVYSLNGVTGADGEKHDWPPIPVRQAEQGRTGYWWVKLGDVSAPDVNNQRNVTIDTGILGTDQYNAQWHLNPDDLPDKDARMVITDRGQWSDSPKVVYTGSTGSRTPDGTLGEDVAASLGWAGEEPLIFTEGEMIDEPYHFGTITRLRWIMQRLSPDNGSLTDAELYARLTGTTKGWEAENELEISRVWRNSVLWECLVDGTTQKPTLGCTDWLLISGGTFSLGFYTDGDDPTPIMGLAVRPGSIDETVVPYLIWGQEDISNMVTAWRWERESQYEALDEAWANSAHTDPADPTSPLKSRTRTLHLTTDDLPANWDSNDGRVGFKCTAYFLMDGEEAEIMNRISIV